MEGGLDLSRKRQFKGINANFTTAEFPENINLKDIEFQLGICIESFEHIPPKLICPYLNKLSKLNNVNYLITVPYEKGLFFSFKENFKA